MPTSPESSPKPGYASETEAFRRLARSSPAFFVAHAVGDGTGRPGLAPALLHVGLQRFLSAHRLALVELPRDHGKTTQLCARVVWELGRDPMLRVKIVCGTESIALDRGRYLQYLIGHRNVRRVFPQLRPGRPWAADGFSVVRPAETVGPSVACLGVGAGATGTRADLLVLDDVADIAAVHSKSRRDRVSSIVTDTLLNLLEPDGRVWAAFTPWHVDDANARLKRTPGFKLFRAAVGPDYAPVWPAKWPREALERRAQEIGTAAFARGFRLTPIAEGECPIRPEWVQYYSEPAAHYDRVILSVDPAVGTGPRADRSAIVALGQIGTEVHVLEAFARRASAVDLLPLIAAADLRHRPQVILFENNAAFEAVRILYARLAGFGPRLLGNPQKVPKSDRVGTFAVFVQTGAVKLKKDDIAQRELFDEMTAFPFGEHDDLLDATATGAIYLLKGQQQPRIWLV